MNQTEQSSRRIVLTGVSRGLGRALAEGLAREGHTVLGCARSAGPLEELRARLGPPHRLEVVDVADDGAVAAWARSILADGAPDLVINNAALMNRSAPLWQVPAEELSRVVDVNVKGVVNVIRHFVPAMLAVGRGVVVNFSSYWGRSASAEVAPYCATKWAVEGLTAALAEDFALHRAASAGGEQGDFALHRGASAGGEQGELQRSHPGAAGGREDPQFGRGDAAHAERQLPEPLAAVALNPGVIDTEMLRSCFGAGAGSYPSPDTWARAAVPCILGLGQLQNGQALTVPGF